MRGASALEELLRRTPDPKLRVFVVWEPVLPTDRDAPLSRVRSRVTDPRVRQFWDRGRLVSRELRRHPEVARACGAGDEGRDGIVWDAIALYPRSMKWDDALESPEFFDTPVVGAIERVGSLLSSPDSATTR